MIHKIRHSVWWAFPIVIGVCLLALLVYVRETSAINALPTPEPKPGAYGLGAVKTQPPPTQAATITTPGSGASFSSSPITINGICPDGLLVQVFNNSVMVGSVVCKNGSFSLQVSLFAGTNELSAIVYDDLDQAGPTSNIVTVTYTDTRFSAFGALITLTSSYGRRSAAAGSALSWPLQLSGGTGPYAFSIDWGDGSTPELKSQSLPGLIPIAHTYKKAGISQVNVKVTDINGVSAFLQVIAVANGRADTTSSSTDKATGDVAAAEAAAAAATRAFWIQVGVSLVLLPSTFWLGRLSQTVSIRNKMLKERDGYKKDKST